MANLVKCTRKIDETPIYLNLDTVMWLRWNEDENFTIVSWAAHQENVVRVLERPEDILKGADSRLHGGSADASERRHSSRERTK
jgi:hypothetical protein